MKKIICRQLLLFVISSIILCGCNTVEETEPIIMVDVSYNDVVYNMDEISVGEVVLTKKVSCEYVQTQDQQIAFETGGKTVDKVYVKVGDYVKEGDLLLTMENGNILDEIADLEYNVARNKLLLGYLDKAEEFDKQSEEYTYIYEYYSPQTETEINNHNHKLFLIEEKYDYQRQDYNDSIDFDSKKIAQLKKEYEENRVYATMSGKVINIKADLEGSIAKKDDVIMTIVDNESGLFEIDNKEDEKYFVDGKSVPMNVIYGSAKGEYELLPHANSENEGNLQFEIVSKPQNSAIEVGTSGTILATVDRKENVLRIPNKALYEANGKYYTYVLSDNNMREAVFISVGLVGDEYTEVLSGIKEGMKVVSR